MRASRFFAFFLLLFAGFCCAGADLTDRIPASADLAVKADCRALLKNPLLADRLQDLTEALQNSGVPEQYAKNPADCFGSALLCIDTRDRNGFILLEAPHITLENIAAFAKTIQQKAELGSCGPFRSLDLQPGNTDPALIVELQNGLFLLTDQSKAAQNTGNYPKNAELKKLLASTEKKAVLRGALIAKNLPQPKDPQQAGQLPKLQASTLSLQLTGKDGSRVILDTGAIAPNEQEAAKMQLTIQQMLLMVSIVMGDDPELAQEVIQSVRLSRNGLTVRCHADLSPALTKRLAEYAEKKAGERQGSKQQSAPQPETDL